MASLLETFGLDAVATCTARLVSGYLPDGRVAFGAGSFVVKIECGLPSSADQPVPGGMGVTLFGWERGGG